MEKTQAMVQALAAALDLTIDPASLAGVAAQYERLLVQARLVLEAPLDESLEPAPVYRL